MTKPSITACLSAVCAYLLAGTAATADDAIDFNQDIRPILSENCYHCHGQDAEGRKGDLRLDLEEEAKKITDGHAAITPENREKSKAWELLVTADTDERMPPLKSNRKLTSKEIELLGKWIDSGAHYAPHWAYIPPTRDKADRKEIDRFVNQRLKKENLEALPEADRRTLLRRVSLDLTGLPPTPTEIAGFLADSSDQAYEIVVDRLLSSKRFGERWARPWLDAARYADSNGFQADQLRDSWAYRDWVIDAMNTNMPFDQFTIEQLAGDLLPNASLSQKIATGFHRTVTCNVEAGVHPEENRYNQVVDRVNTTGTVWLGTTLACVQCHDHKYDPFSMKDYYGIFSFFNNTPLEVENPSGKGVSFNFFGPKMPLPVDEGVTKKKTHLQAQIKDLDKQRKGFTTDKKAGREAWESSMLVSLKNPTEWQVLKIANFKSAGDETIEILDDQSVLITGRLPGTAHYEITCKTNLSGITAFKLEALTHDQLPGKGPGRGDDERTNFILSEFAVRASSPGSADSQLIELVSAQADFSQNNWSVENAIDGNQKTGWAISPEFHKPHWAVFLTAEACGSEVASTTLNFTLDQNYGRGRTLGRVRLLAFTGDPGAVEIPENITTILQTAPEKRSKKQRSALDVFYVKTNPQLQQLETDLKRAKKQLATLPSPSTLVMIEMDKPRETFVMKRGNYLSPAEKVSATTPAALHPFKTGLPANRLGFAKWLMDPANPLVARVIVNRWWSELFGHGLVSTIEDFGTQSTPPTHPELLDWLAVEFMGSGWDMKHTLKTIVLSDVYRRDSKVTPLLRTRDPENRFYARGPRFRMSAEMIRDNALTVSGLLSTKMHGPPIMPYQPNGIWRQVGRNEPKWIEEKDENRFRRGVYVVWRRAAPYPSFVNFDAPDRSACLVKRPRTNTPLQALTLMNDPAYVEIALALAGRIISERPKADIGDRINYGFELVLGRKPKSQEREYLIAVFQERFQHMQNDPDDAAQIVKNGGPYIKLPDKIPAKEMAAWFYIASILLNLDETINKG